MSNVLLLAGYDNANVGHLLAKSLKAVDVNAVALKRNINPRRSKKMQARLYKPGDKYFFGAVKKADVIIHMHSIYTRIPPNLLKGKMIVVFHGGTQYRMSPKALNALFNPLVDLSLIQTGELLILGAKNPYWLLPPVDLEQIKPKYAFGGSKLIVGHFPSKPGLAGNHPYSKGSLLIKNMMKNLRKEGQGNSFEYRTGASLIPWRKNLQRMGNCDIYIESIGRAVKRNTGKHDWSVTALEACALGCITITNFVYWRRYVREYGEHGLIVANEAKVLKQVLMDLFEMNRDELLALKHKARAWVEEKHSFEAVGTRLKLILGL